MDEPSKYREIATDLQAKIESGDLPAGAKLPSDAELGETYSASRNTVREAVKFLVSRGMLEKRGGRGTFVPDKKIEPFSTVVSVTAGFGGFEGAAYASDASARNRKAAVTTPKVEIQEASGDIAADLVLAAGAEVVIRHQERSIDGRLWSMQTTFYPMQFVDDGAKQLLRAKDIPDGTRSYLDNTLGIREIGSHDTMRVRAPNAGEASAFGIPDDGRIAVFETRQVGVNESREPVRVTISIYPADRNEFSMETGALADDPQPKPSG